MLGLELYSEGYLLQVEEGIRHQSLHDSRRGAEADCESEGWWRFFGASHYRRPRLRRHRVGPGSGGGTRLWESDARHLHPQQENRNDSRKEDSGEEEDEGPEPARCGARGGCNSEEAQAGAIPQGFGAHRAVESRAKARGPLQPPA